MEASVVDEDSNGNVIRTVNKTWYNNQQLASEQTVLENGQTSMVTYQYAPGGGLARKQEYDFGLTYTAGVFWPVPSGPPARTTTIAYQPFQNIPSGVCFVLLFS